MLGYIQPYVPEPHLLDEHPTHSSLSNSSKLVMEYTNTIRISELMLVSIGSHNLIHWANYYLTYD